MSKLYDLYENLKQKDSKTLYLFKSGIFYIFLDEDAKIIHNLFNLKLTNLNDKIVKCGFPASSLDKYIKLLNQQTAYEFKIIDNNTSTSYNLNDYSLDKSVKDLLLRISNINTENISVQEAYLLLDDFKEKAKKLLLEVI